LQPDAATTDGLAPAAAVPTAGFPPLPATSLEVQQVASLCREALGEAAAIEVLTGAGASHERLRALAPRVRILHLATHGYFAPTDAPDALRADSPGSHGLLLAGQQRDLTVNLSPLVLCGLALSGANEPQDAQGQRQGILTADELARFDLSACELAVLSACETSIGVSRPGQGLASLQLALHAAGARCVIASLWKVADEPTRALMVEFYQKLLLDRQPPRAALWQAKRALRDARAGGGKPRYRMRDWAGFVLSGER
jgi:CHAT domain-containing protein